MDGSGTADQVERAAQSPGDSMAEASHTREVDPLTVTQRLQREGRWKDIETERNEMMKLARKRFKTEEERQHWVYSELDRLYPSSQEIPEQTTVNRILSSHTCTVEGGDSRVMPSSDSGAIKGLGDIPAGWPELPANSSLSAEVGWVQANRLRVIEETAGGQTLVHLGQALSPAPSWAALGWLETSIRSYAKYVDVAAKATASDDGESAVIRRERVAIEDVSALLDEMKGEG